MELEEEQANLAVMVQQERRVMIVKVAILLESLEEMVALVVDLEVVEMVVMVAKLKLKFLRRLIKEFLSMRLCLGNQANHLISQELLVWVDWVVLDIQNIIVIVY